jgi:Asp/Glu/hydantoin racemase
MKRLLMINPNVTESVTEKVAEAGRRFMPDVDIRSRSGRFGAAYISSRASYAVAGHAALDRLAEEGDWADAVLLACFGDPGLEALREVSPAPVIGLIEASCAEAAQGGRRFAIVTGGERWKPMLEEAIGLGGFGDRLARILAVAPTGGQIANDPEGALALLAQSCRDCVERDGAEAVILGGAGLIGLAARVAPMVGAPVICSVEAGLRAARSALDAPSARKDASTVATPSSGLFPALTDLLATGRLAPR